MDSELAKLEERWDRAVDRLEQRLQRIEDKLDSKQSEVEKRLRTVEQKLAWYAGASSLVGALVGFFAHRVLG